MAADGHARDDLAQREADAQHQREKAELVDEGERGGARASQTAANSMGRADENRALTRRATITHGPRRSRACATPRLPTPQGTPSIMKTIATTRQK